MEVLIEGILDAIRTIVADKKAPFYADSTSSNLREYGLETLIGRILVAYQISKHSCPDLQCGDQQPKIDVIKTIQPKESATQQARQPATSWQPTSCDCFLPPLGM